MARCHEQGTTASWKMVGIPHEGQLSICQRTSRTLLMSHRGIILGSHLGTHEESRPGELSATSAKLGFWAERKPLKPTV